MPYPTVNFANPAFSLMLLFACALVISLLVRFWLATRQMRHVAIHSDAVPAAFEGTVSLEAHRKAARYTLTKGSFGLWSMAFGAAVLIGWTLLGGLGWLNTSIREAVQPLYGNMAYQVALLAAFVLIGSLLDLPFDLYSTFRIEQAFGFNRMTWKLYAADAIKALLLGALIGLPLAAAMLWIMGSAGRGWWLWAWAAWMGFNLLALVLYPTVIAPLFNTFKPLADASLEARVKALMAKCGFFAKGFFVMDGSRRSAHANAYFTGFGAAKRVVFFDTLLDKLSPSEVEAVLAHELGHFKHKHVLKRLLSMFALSLMGFAVLGWLSGRSWFYTSLGVEPSMSAPNDAVALLLFMLIVPVFSFFIAPVFAGLSRRHEFQADAYACANSNGNDLAVALLKLYGDNASTLTPDPLYARFYYSHPPAGERLAAMRTLALKT
ncbi:MAG: M48 family metallopeptidase [Burkholderiaceae bacterium]|nr:M48 family metallopeptidase [Burkholderiaceae bacterium]